MPEEELDIVLELDTSVDELSVPVPAPAPELELEAPPAPEVAVDPPESPQFNPVREIARTKRRCERAMRAHVNKELATRTLGFPGAPGRAYLRPRKAVFRGPIGED